MKKILSIFVLAGLFIALSAPMILAIEDIPSGCTLKGNAGLSECDTWKDAKCDPNAATTPCPGVCCLMNTVNTITNWLFYILILVVTLMIIYGGFILLTGQGDPEKVGKGKGIVTFAIIGLAVALLAKVVPSVVKYIMGVS